MNKMELVTFFRSLPNEETRTFENEIVKVAMKNSSKEEELFLEEIMNDPENKDIAYSAFYCLNALFRHKKDYGRLKKLFEQYPNFNSHVTYLHLFLMYQIEGEVCFDYHSILAKAYELTQKLPNHSGIVHLFPATFASVLESCDEESKKELNEKWFNKALEAVNRAISLEPSYAKFYATRARVLAANNDYGETSFLLKRAISLEDSSRVDYALRVSSYQYYQLQIKLQQQQQIIKDLEKKLEDKNTHIQIADKPVAYQGTDPFIFISYSHQNKELVFPVIQKLMDMGYRIWYDEGIELGQDYNDFIASKILKASVFILFASNAAVVSQYVRKEICYASECHKEPLLFSIEETFFSPGMQIQFNSKQSISLFSNTWDYCKRKIEKVLPMETNAFHEAPKINLLSYICEPGGEKPNEDLFFQDDFSCYVLDGSTSLIPSPYAINAKWYVESFKKEFLKQDSCLSLKTMVENTISSIKRRVMEETDGKYDFENNMVCASFGGIHIRKSMLEVFVLSDCTVIVELKNGEKIRFTVEGGVRKLDKKVISRVIELHNLYDSDVISLRHFPEIEKMLVENRLKMNKSDGYYTLAFSKEAVSQGIFASYPLEQVKKVWIHSDGFDLVDSQIESTYLPELYSRLRAIEEDDAQCNQYPRFKKSDDATCILVGLSKES